MTTAENVTGGYLPRLLLEWQLDSENLALGPVRLPDLERNPVKMMDSHHETLARYSKGTEPP